MNNNIAYTVNNIQHNKRLIKSENDRFEDLFSFG